MAFTQSVTLISGVPTPGTGKTFIGGKIVNVLTTNGVLSDGNPMLVLTLTQHALDSFMLDPLIFESPDAVDEFLVLFCMTPLQLMKTKQNKTKQYQLLPPFTPPLHLRKRVPARFWVRPLG